MSPGPKDMEESLSLTVTWPSIMRQVSFCVYDQSNVLCSQVQMGQVLQVLISFSVGFFICTSLTSGISNLH